MTFRKAKKEEADRVRALYGAVIGLPFCTWNEDYPGEEEIRSDLSSGTLYVLEDGGELFGAISIVPENELDGFDCWKVKEGAREFARVVISPDRQQKGLSHLLVEGILEVLSGMGTKAVHLSVAKKNVPARKLYESTGFKITGEADMYGNSYYLCEKML